MLHYSNASSIEKNRRYLVIKGGACLVALAREGFVVDVVDHRVTGSGLWVYRKEVMEGNTINNRIIKVKHGNARSKRRPNAVVGDTGGGG